MFCAGVSKCLSRKQFFRLIHKKVRSFVLVTCRQAFNPLQANPMRHIAGAQQFAGCSQAK